PAVLRAHLGCRGTGGRSAVAARPAPCDRHLAGGRLARRRPCEPAPASCRDRDRADPGARRPRGSAGVGLVGLAMLARGYLVWPLAAGMVRATSGLSLR